LLERVSLSIDIVKGIKKDKKKTDNEDELCEIKKNFDSKYTHSNINYIKDQTSRMIINTEIDLFDIDNTYYPFIPKIHYKPNALNGLNPGIAEARETRKMNSDYIKQINFRERKTREYDENKRLFAHPYGDEIRNFFNNLSDRYEKINNVLAPYKDKLRFNKIKIFDLLELNNNGDMNSNFYMIKNQLKKISLEQKYEAIKKYTNLNYKCFVENPNQKLTIDDFKNNIINEDFNNNNNSINSYNNLNKNNKYTNDYINFFEIEYLSLDLTNLIYVDTQEALSEMISEISNFSSEIAVDLEHHQKESFLGMTCLIQISTRFTDYIIDAIKLRSHLQELNKVFTDPKIVKVLHGSDFDVLWLQKDFGVYLVNMFDTGQAARILNFSSFSLAYLLGSICGINPNKEYQLADWRIRPLPEDMLKYAREDTHYLLYCYDVLKNQLVKKSLVKNEPPLYSIILNYKKSCDIALKEYIKPSVKEPEYYQLKAQNVSTLNKKQFSIMKLIYKYRDYVARKLDFSTHYILPNKLLFHISKAYDFNDPTNFKNKILEILNNKENNGKFSIFIRHLNEMMEYVNEKILKLRNKNDDKDSKQLENNYLENMKKNYYNVNKNNPKNMIIASASQTLNIFDGGKKDLDQNSNNKKNFNLKEFAKECEIKQIKTKDDIRLPFNESVIFSKSNKNQKLKNNLTESFPSINYKNEYNSIIKKFENFNLITFLQEGKSNLQIKIKTVERKEPKKEQNPEIDTPIDIKNSNEQMESVYDNSINKLNKKQEKNYKKAEENLEKFLQMKRKQEMIDLTDYNIYQKKEKNKDSGLLNKSIKNDTQTLSLHSSDDASENSIDSEPEILDFINKRKGLIKEDLNLKSKMIKGNLLHYLIYFLKMTKNY